MRSLLLRSGRIAIPIGAVGGFIGDILQPLAPFSAYLFFISLALLIVSGTVWYGKKKKQLKTALADGKITQEEFTHLFQSSRWLTIFVFSAIATPILLIIFLLGTKHEERGFIGSNVASISKLQDTLFDIQKDVKEIKETTHRIEKTTEKISQDTKKTLVQLDKVIKGFENLEMDKGGIISNPSSPQEYYHNAKFYELEGNFAKARQAYSQYFKYNLDFIDPHLDYQMMLKIQEGSEGTKEIYRYMVAKNKESLVLQFVWPLLLNQEQRIKKLEEFALKYPDFAPAFYQLSLEYSEEKVGEQTLADKKQEKSYLRKFVELDNKGLFLKYFLDKKVASEYREEAANRLKALEFIADAVLEAPVMFEATTRNNAWIIDFKIADTIHVKEVFYKMEENDEFESLGFLDSRNPDTGEPLPRMQVTGLKLEHGNYPIWVKYLDIKNTEYGPFKLEFDTKKTLINNSKEALNNNKEWLRFSDPKDSMPGRHIISFERLTIHRHVLKDINYSLDNENLDKSFAFTPSTELSPDEGEPFMTTVPSSTKWVMVKLSFIDGSELEARKFDNTATSEN